MGSGKSTKAAGGTPLSAGSSPDTEDWRAAVCSQGFREMAMLSSGYVFP